MRRFSLRAGYTCCLGRAACRSADRTGRYGLRTRRPSPGRRRDARCARRRPVRSSGFRGELRRARVARHPLRAAARRRAALARAAAAGRLAGAARSARLRRVCTQFASDLGDDTPRRRARRSAARTACSSTSTRRPSTRPRVPQGDARLPVMVWIHGGGNTHRQLGLLRRRQPRRARGRRGGHAATTGSGPSAGSATRRSREGASPAEQSGNFAHARPDARARLGAARTSRPSAATRSNVTDLRRVGRRPERGAAAGHAAARAGSSSARSSQSGGTRSNTLARGARTTRTTREPGHRELVARGGAAAARAGRSRTRRRARASSTALPDAQIAERLREHPGARRCSRATDERPARHDRPAAGVPRRRRAARAKTFRSRFARARRASRRCRS